MLSDPRGARFRIDDHILHHRQRLERVPEVRNYDDMTRPDDFPADLRDEDRMISVAREAMKRRRQPHFGDAQAQVIL